eukprot:6527923-Pyramimonas_sp.AAC.1
MSCENSLRWACRHARTLRHCSSIHVHALAVWTLGRDPADTRPHGCVAREASARHGPPPRGRDPAGGPTRRAGETRPPGGVARGAAAERHPVLAGSRSRGPARETVARGIPDS